MDHLWRSRCISDLPEIHSLPVGLCCVFWASRPTASFLFDHCLRGLREHRKNTGSTFHYHFQLSHMYNLDGVFDVKPLVVSPRSLSGRRRARFDRTGGTSAHFWPDKADHWPDSRPGPRRKHRSRPAAGITTPLAAQLPGLLHSRN